MGLQYETSPVWGTKTATQEVDNVASLIKKEKIDQTVLALVKSIDEKVHQFSKSLYALISSEGSVRLSGQ